ncbi:MAG: hypothetical protein MJ074_06670 [Oscillospiraceae bacterium]|nr:hypothetical protein [Oscillospiraceae bacterium]
MVTKIISGEVTERIKSRISRRPSKRGGRIRGNSSEKKIMGNREAAVLRLARILNCNFEPGDLWLTLTFDEESLDAIGDDWEAAKKEEKKFKDRVLYRLKKAGITARWVLAASEMDGETGEVVRKHAHVVITSDGFHVENKRLYLGEELLDDIWGMGTVDYKFLRHQKDYYPIAKYIVNQARGVADEKKWTCSRNMKKPIVRREIVTSGSQLRVPNGATELPGTRYDPEKDQNMVRYIPKKRDPRRKIGGHKEMALAMSGPGEEDTGGDGDEL